MLNNNLIKDNKSLDFLPNYVTLKNGLQIDKAEYVDMAIRTEAYIRANKRLPAIVYRMSTLPDYKDSTMKLFTNTFNFKGNTIDEALAVIAKKKLYSKYFDSQKTDVTSYYITRCPFCQSTKRVFPLSCLTKSRFCGIMIIGVSGLSPI